MKPITQSNEAMSLPSNVAQGAPVGGAGSGPFDLLFAMIAVAPDAAVQGLEQDDPAVGDGAAEDDQSPTDGVDIALFEGAVPAGPQPQVIYPGVLPDVLGTSPFPATEQTNDGMGVAPVAHVQGLVQQQQTTPVPQWMLAQFGTISKRQAPGPDVTTDPVVPSEIRTTTDPLQFDGVEGSSPEVPIPAALSVPNVERGVETLETRVVNVIPAVAADEIPDQLPFPVEKVDSRDFAQGIPVADVTEPKPASAKPAPAMIKAEAIPVDPAPDEDKSIEIVQANPLKPTGNRPPAKPVVSTRAPVPHLESAVVQDSPPVEIQGIPQVRPQRSDGRTVVPGATDVPDAREMPRADNVVSQVGDVKVATDLVQTTSANASSEVPAPAAQSVLPKPDIAIVGGSVQLETPVTVRQPIPVSVVSAPPPEAALNTRQADWGRQLIDRIERISRDGSESLELSLRPKTLGALRISLEIQGDRTSVHFVTETGSAARMLLGNEDKLSQLLDQSGFRLGGFSAQGGGAGGGQNGQPHSRKERASVQTAKRMGAGSPLEAQKSSSVRNGTGPESSVNMLA